MMAKLLLLLVVVCAVFTVGEFAGILRKQFLQEPVYVKGEADPGQPLFLTPYVNKKDYRTGNCLLVVSCLTCSCGMFCYQYIQCQ